MQVFEIPKRKERIELMKRSSSKLDILDKIKRRELEGAIRFRLTEKVVISALGLGWLCIGLYGQTPYCKIFGIPFAIITLLGGLWIV